MPARHVFEALTRDIDARQPSEAGVRGADPEEGLRDAARGLLGAGPTRHRRGPRGPAAGGRGGHLPRAPARHARRRCSSTSRSSSRPSWCRRSAPSSWPRSSTRWRRTTARASSRSCRPRSPSARCATLTPDELKIARQLLGYPEGTAGRYMTPEYVALRPGHDRRARRSSYIREHGARASRRSTSSTSSTSTGVLLDDLRLRDAGAGRARTRRSRDIDDAPAGRASRPPTTARRWSAAFEKYDRVALPVTDSRGVLLGIITVDDVLDVAEQEATEDIQKLGGMRGPRRAVPRRRLLRRWSASAAAGSSALFLGEMLTATAMGDFEDEIAQRGGARAVRAADHLAPAATPDRRPRRSSSARWRSRELKLRDWWRVFAPRDLRRASRSGLLLGVDRLPAHRPLGEGVAHALRRALLPGRAHRRRSA